MGASSDDGQQPVVFGGVFRRVYDRNLYFGLQLLVITDVKFSVGGLRLEITGPKRVWVKRLIVRTMCMYSGIFSGTVDGIGFGEGKCIFASYRAPCASDCPLVTDL